MGNGASIGASTGVDGENSSNSDLKSFLIFFQFVAQELNEDIQVNIDDSICTSELFKYIHLLSEKRIKNIVTLQRTEIISYYMELSKGIFETDDSNGVLLNELDVVFTSDSKETDQNIVNCDNEVTSSISQNPNKLHINQVSIIKESEEEVSLECLNKVLALPWLNSLVLSNINISNCSSVTGITQPSNIGMLSFASNPLTTFSITNTMATCPSTLVVLDLSYCSLVDENEGSEEEGSLNMGLKLYPGCFLPCTQLTRLVLDGCGLRTTMCMEGLKCDLPQIPKLCSLFLGLFQLQELSLKENAFQEPSDILSGFQCLSLCCACNSEKKESTNSSCVELGLGKLEHLWLNENPIVSTNTAGYKQCTQQLTQCVSTCQDNGLTAIDGGCCHLPALKYINDVAVANSGVGSSSTRNAFKSVGLEFKSMNTRQDVNTSNELMLGNEKEFLHALKGEKDNTVVA